MLRKKAASVTLKPNVSPVPIVAIGGSAGALEAVSEILKNLSPDTGLAFVYIQHQSPTHESQLDLILGQLTEMPVRTGAHQMHVEPDHVYVIPPDKNLELIDGVLTQSPLATHSVHMTIDQFFISLADRQKDGAIGILLSGAGTDGTIGLKAIKVAGGVTIVQDESAEFQSMPKSPVAEGLVDMVLSPAEIAAELERLSKQADVFRLTSTAEEDQEDGAEDEDLNTILQFIKTAVNVDFDHYKITTVRRRIIRRMLLYKLHTLKAYMVYLEQNPSEATVLYNDLLINVTTFFRDHKTMDYVKKEILPNIIKNKGPREPIRIWVAACSTGQEAYSLAMMLLEVLGDRAGSMLIQIFASDLSEMAIARARVGSYSQSEILDVSSQRLARFFTKTDDHYRINKAVRDMCVFAPHNLLRDPPFSRLDLVSCRNLLIYLDSVLQQKALTSFHYALNPEGFLLLGKSEAVGSAPSLFMQIEKNVKIFSRRNVIAGRISFDMSPSLAGTAGNKNREAKSLTSKNISMSSISDLDKLVDKLLLTKYVPASVVVDQDLEIIQFRGSTGLFLEPSPGKPSFNLAKMARTSLVFELRNIIHKARKSGVSVRKTGLEVKVNDKVHLVQIQAIPINTSPDRPLCLVLFEEQEASILPDTGGEKSSGNRINELEAELAGLREDMHSIIEEQEAGNEELQSANEEIVSSNEELQSINEELETSKEEIESANEELLTINQELQVRNDQLSEAYGYSEAILSTINEATLVLDKDLRVRSANKAFYKIFRILREETQGKMLYELDQRQWDIEELRTMLENVILRDAEVKAFEVTLNFPGAGEKIMLLHARKVVQQQRQHAILLVIEDITEHRKAQKLLLERQEWFEDLVNNAPTLIWVSKPDGKINFLNKAWKEFTGQSGNTDIGINIHPEDQKAYIVAYSEGFLGRKQMNLEYRLKRHDGEYRWMIENAKPMFGTDGQFSGYMGTSTEVHIQKTLTQELNRHVDQRTQELKEANLELEVANKDLIRTADLLQSVLNGVPAAVTLMEEVRDPLSGLVADFSVSVFNEPARELNVQTSGDLLFKPIRATKQMKEWGLFDTYLHVLTSGQPAYRELSGLCTDGDCFAFYITRKVGNTGVVVTILDITRRKAGEAKLTQTAQSLQAVLDSSPGSIGFLEGVYAKSGQPEDFKLVVFNRRFSGKHDRSLGELEGKLASALYSGDGLLQMKEVLQTGKTFYEEKLIEDDTWLAISVTRHEEAIVVTELDITALKKAETQQHQLMKQLEGSHETLTALEVMRQYVRDRGEFLRATSHDLRGSFGIIVGAAGLLNMMDSEEDKARILDMIQRNLQQVTQMMNQLLDYSRLESGQEKLEISSFDASEVCTELGKVFEPMAAAKNLKIIFKGPKRLPVRGDIVKVHRIAQNLVLNALKYTTTGKINVSWDTSEDRLHKKNWFLQVQDTGPGMPAALVAKLTSSNPGNLTISHATSPGGEGIGLFIVKRLIELMGGVLQIDSGPENGTTILISFPLANE